MAQCRVSMVAYCSVTNKVDGGARTCECYYKSMWCSYRSTTHRQHATAYRSDGGSAHARSEQPDRESQWPWLNRSADCCLETSTLLFSSVSFSLSIAQVLICSMIEKLRVFNVCGVEDPARLVSPSGVCNESRAGCPDDNSVINQPVSHIRYSLTVLKWHR